MESQPFPTSRYLDARDEIVRRNLWKRKATALENLFYTVAPRSIQGRVQMRTIQSTPSHVHAVGIGGKNGGDEPAVVVYVTRKLPEGEIPPDEMVPKTVNGVVTDVVESPMPQLAACTDNRRTRTRPLVGGISVGRSGGPSGTLGGFVRSTRPGDPADALYVLSNSHVLFSGSGRIAGVRIVQPAAGDGADDRIALLERATTLQPGKVLTADAAIARLDAPAGIVNEICGIGAIAAPVPPQKNMAVDKHGRTSGLTTGTVAAIGLSAEALDENGRRLQFSNVFRIEPATPRTAVARLGDSGSLVVRSMDHAAVGLLYAADPAGSFYLAQPIADVCAEMEIALKLD